MADAPGEPGQPPRWVPSGKSGVGRALCDDSRVWFTIGQGILNEIAYPRIEQTAVRDFGLILTDGETLFAEERRDCHPVVTAVAPGIPAYDVASFHEGGRFSLAKRIVADPHRPAILQHVRVTDLGLADAPRLRVHALLAPHLVNVTGMGSAWVGEYKGVPMLFAEGQGTAVALAADCGWRMRSAGYAGISDGWQDLSRHRRMDWQYERAINGNVALTGELDWTARPDGFVVVLGFGRIWTEAAMRARAALDEGFPAIAHDYEAGWRRWQDGMRPLGAAVGGSGSTTDRCYRASLGAVRTHECPSVLGARISSLGVPWAALQNDLYPAACHLVRVRDVVSGAGALLAAGSAQPTLDALSYLRTVQEADGHWPQNFWLDGMAAWQGLQLDETAQPVLLADLALRQGILDPDKVAGLWPMVRRAALFLAQHEPYEGQDRWGRTDGHAIHTVGAQLAALLIAAGWAGRAGQEGLRDFLFETADCVRETLSADLDALPDAEPDSDLVSLIRLGVLSPHDPRLEPALAAIDATLRVALPGGPGWCRRGHAGRPTRPVLTIERALLSVQAGRLDEARALLASVEASAGDNGLLPERVDHESGHGGLVMPHHWTHAEHIKLLRAIDDRAVFDLPPQAALRYPDGQAASLRIARWRPDRPVVVVRRGRRLRVELPVAAELHWSSDQWSSVRNTPTVELAEGLCVAELPTDTLPPGSRLLFTWRETEQDLWHATDHHIEVCP
jgi:glucoamylase